MVEAGSRFLSGTQSRYAMIELKCLRAAWAMQKCRQFLEGLKHFELVVDHKPLVPILNEYTLDKLGIPMVLRPHRHFCNEKFFLGLPWPKMTIHGQK